MQEVNPYMDDEERLCVICLVNERNTTVLPCRHVLASTCSVRKHEMQQLSV